MVPGGRNAQSRLHVVCNHVKPQTQHALLQPEPTAATPALGRTLSVSYDYIVVGAGSAGCVLASRLSEDPKVSVLLIEAGGSNQKFAVRSPFITCPTLQNSDLDWKYRTTNQATTDDRVSFWPRGKGLGGCSSINYMAYVRGDPKNYDDWAERQQCAGWSYNDVLPFFKKSEGLLGKDLGPAHGRDGPLSVTQMSEFDFMAKAPVDAWVQSCEAAGLPATSDYNGPCQRGASLLQANVKEGVRCDTASAFLFSTGALARGNLTVITNTSVSRIVIQDAKAVGVCVQREGEAKTTTVNASREILLSCGAVGTPHLLMLSGIGPEAHLKEHGIECIKDLPVGENLQDHLMVANTYRAKSGKEPAFAPMRPFTGGLISELARHLFFGTGTLSFPWLSGTAFENSHVPGQDESQGNDIQIHFIGFAGADQKQMEDNFGFVKRADRPMTDAANLPLDGVTFLPINVLPKSRGTVRLASADPKQHPTIEPRYLSHPQDMDVTVAAMKLCRRIAASPPLCDILGEEVSDPSIPHDHGSDEYTREVIRRGCLTVYHPVGTAKMGPVSDDTAVVDTRLRVHGIHGLRVVDASIMPTIVSGNTNAPTIMIGERGASFICEDRNQTSM